jgi:hypothetical protein
MKRRKLVEIDTGQAIAIGEHETLRTDPGLQPPHASAGTGHLAGLHEMNRPLLGLAAMPGHLASRKLNWSSSRRAPGNRGSSLMASPRYHNAINNSECPKRW